MRKNDKDNEQKYRPGYAKKSNALEKIIVTVRPIRHNDFCFIFPFLWDAELAVHLTRKKLPEEMAFVAIYQKLPTGILEIKKSEKSFTGKLTFFFTANTSDIVRISQNLLLEAMVDYSTDN